MTNQQIRDSLVKWVPVPQLADIFAEWIVEYRIKVVVTRSRKTKRATYMPPQRGAGHKITINHDLNPYGFVVTFIHEMAHLITWNEYQNNVRPHGKEWKLNFKKLITPYLNHDYFPPDILTQLVNYMNNPAASSCSDAGLMKVLDRYNDDDDGMEYLEDLPLDTEFALKDGRVFKKLNKLRKYYQCEERKSKSMYRISPVARVKRL
ncbi:MAG: sprT domain-containing protein [Thalassobius sp.]|nr:sprT domain-containing protein [Thalassovita sp.]